MEGTRYIKTTREMTRFICQVVMLVVIMCFMLYSLYIRNYVVLEYVYPPYKASEGLLQTRISTSTAKETSVSPVDLSESSKNSTPPCYRQVQFWMGTQNTVNPKEYPCEGVKCGIRHVEDTSFETMRQSDAVVLFHRSSWDWAEMHKRRPPGQKWLFYTLESPRHTSGRVIPPAPFYDNSYDYTIGFRKESTFVASYGYYDPTEPEITGNEHRNWASEKSRVVAWMASNCNIASWRRRDFVIALSKHIKVDMYGGCGNLNCPRNSKCADVLKTYKFYLAIENSECRDYITEKFWRNSLENGIVPVVYGTIKEDYQRVAPPHSFIHLHDFTSLAEVADFLRRVDANDTLYNSYLEWKKHGSIKHNIHSEYLGPHYLCQVVKRLLEDEENEGAGIKPNSSVPDLNSWWRDSCNTGSGFPRNF